MRVFEQVSEEYPIGQAHVRKSTMVLLSDCMYVLQITMGGNLHHSYHFSHSVHSMMHRLHGRLQDTKSISTRTSVTVFRSLPVDDIPDVLDIGCLSVLVLKVVRMLPLHVESVICYHGD